MEGNFKLIQPGENYYFTLCSPDFLAIGGGSHFALYLDNDLWEHSLLIFYVVQTHISHQLS